MLGLIASGDSPRYVGATRNAAISASFSGAASIAPPPKPSTPSPAASPRRSGNQRCAPQDAESGYTGSHGKTLRPMLFRSTESTLFQARTVCHPDLKVRTHRLTKQPTKQPTKHPGRGELIRGAGGTVVGPLHRHPSLK